MGKKGTEWTAFPEPCGCKQWWWRKKRLKNEWHWTARMASMCERHKIAKACSFDHRMKLELYWIKDQHRKEKARYNAQQRDKKRGLPKGRRKEASSPRNSQSPSEGCYSEGV
jgi:hypothetical protein